MYVYNVHTTVNVAQVSVIFLRMVFFNSGGGGGGISWFYMSFIGLS